MVYSKKVEFLYNLVFETLDLLSKQKKQKREGSKDKGSFSFFSVTLGLGHLVIDDPVVVLDDSIFGERESIDLKSNEKENQRRSALSVNLLFFYPIQNDHNRYSFLRLYESNMGLISSSLTTDSKDKSFL